MGVCSATEEDWLLQEGGPKSAFEYISQQNHWMLSHDNVWNPLSATAPEGALAILQI